MSELGLINPGQTGLTHVNADTILQGSIEWHALKYGRIGGTLAKSLMGKESTFDGVIDEIVGAHLEPFVYEEQGFLSDDVQRGNDLEPHARAYVSELLEIPFNVPAWIQSDIDCFGLSPDGLSPCRTIALEIKCPSAKIHRKYIRENKIPSEYFWQCIAYFATNPDLGELYFASYRPESLQPLFLKKISLLDEITFKKKQTVMAFAYDLRAKAEEADKEIKRQVEKALNAGSF